MAQLGIKEIVLTTFDSASLSGSYQVINASGTERATFLFSIINGGSTAITVSYDGVHAHDYILANSRRDITGPVNTLPGNRGALMPAGTMVYVKGTAGSGTIAVAGYYQQF